MFSGRSYAKILHPCDHAPGEGLVCVPQLLYFSSGCTNMQKVRGNFPCRFLCSVSTGSLISHFSSQNSLSFFISDSMPENWRYWENGSNLSSTKWKFLNAQSQRNLSRIKDNIHYLKWCVFHWSQDSRPNLKKDTLLLTSLHAFILFKCLFFHKLIFTYVHPEANLRNALNYVILLYLITSKHILSIQYVHLKGQ